MAKAKHVVASVSEIPVGGRKLVDVKGRRFPSGDEHHHYWKNWSTRDDLRSLANFFRDPQWHDIIQRIVEHSTQKDSSSEVQFSQEETNRLGAFGQTPQGRVIVQNGGQVMNLLVRELEVASPRIQARLRQHLGRDLCEAMGSQCPSSLRQATEGI